MTLNYKGSGTVLFENQQYRCDLYMNDQEGSVMIKISIPKGIAGFLELPLKIARLAGELSTGFHFILQNCSRCGMTNLISENRSEYKYMVKYMIYGVGQEHLDVKFSKVSFVLRDIISWGGISYYSLDKEYKVGYSDDPGMVLYEDDDMRVEYNVSGNILPCIESDLLKEKILIEQYGSICIRFSEEKSIEKYTEELMKIKRLIELSALHRIGIDEIWGWSSAVLDANDNQGRTERPVKIISDCIHKSENKLEREDTWRFITLKELLENDGFHFYFEKYEKLEPIVELYMELFREGGISKRRMFLNLVQALETYHSRFKTNNLKEFKRRIEEEILINRSDDFKEKDRKFLMAKSRKFITLESRLADLLLAEFKIYFETGDIPREKFPEVIASTRNYYIHYDERIKEKIHILNDDEVEIYNNVLISMLEYYLLMELGFRNAQKMHEKLISRWGSVSERLSILHASEKRNND